MVKRDSGEGMRPSLTGRALRRAREEPFGPAVLGDSWIFCLECGRAFRLLPPHLTRKHEITAADYKEAWGYARSQPLACREWSEHNSAWAKAHCTDNLTPFRQPPRHEMPPLRKQTLLKIGEAPSPRGEAHYAYRKDVDLETVQALRAQGLNQSEIAARLGCRPELITARLREAGESWAVRRDFTADDVLELAAEGMRLDQIAERLGCSRKLVLMRLRATGLTLRHLRQERVNAAVAAAWRDGCSSQEIAAQVGLTVRAVEERLRFLRRQGRAERSAYGSRPDVTPEAAAELWQECRNVSEVARRLGTTVTTIRKRLRAAGVDVRRHPAVETPPRSESKSAPSKRVIPVEDVVKLWDGGLTVIAIARRLQVDRASVRRRLRAAGIDPKRHQGERRTKPVPPDMAAQLVEAWESGLRWHEMEKRFGVSRHVLAGMLKKVGRQTGRRFLRIRERGTAGPRKRKGRRQPVPAEQLASLRQDPCGPDVFTQDYVVCLECGEKLGVIGRHFLVSHGMSAARYKEKWGYRPHQPLLAGSQREVRSAAGHRRDKDVLRRTAAFARTHVRRSSRGSC